MGTAFPAKEKFACQNRKTVTKAVREYLNSITQNLLPELFLHTKHIYISWFKIFSNFILPIKNISTRWSTRSRGRLMKETSENQMHKNMFCHQKYWFYLKFPFHSWSTFRDILSGKPSLSIGERKIEFSVFYAHYKHFLREVQKGYFKAKYSFPDADYASNFTNHIKVHFCDD